MSDVVARVYLDTGVYIAVIKQEEGRVEASRRAIEEGEAGRSVLMASPLVLAELCGHGEVRAAQDVTQVDKIVNDFFRHPFVHWVELDVPLAYEARVLSRRYRLRGSDAVHLASAIRTKCDALMTWDRGFPIGETVEGVRVMEPAPLTRQIQLGDLEQGAD